MINPTYFNIMDSKKYIDDVKKIRKVQATQTVSEIRDDSVTEAKNESHTKSAPECAFCPFKDTDRCNNCLTGQNLYV